MIKVYFVPKKFELVPTTAEKSDENTVPRLLHQPVYKFSKCPPPKGPNVILHEIFSHP